MSTTVGFLYPGYSAEDDYPAMERLLAASGRGVAAGRAHADARGRPPGRRAARHRRRRRARRGRPVSCGGGRRRGGVGVHAAGASCSAGTGRARRSTACPRGRRGAGVEHVLRVRRRRARTWAYAGWPSARPTPRTWPSGSSRSSARPASRCVSLSCQGIVTAAEVGTLRPRRGAGVRRGQRPPGRRGRAAARHRAAHGGVAGRSRGPLGKPVLTANQVSVWQGLRLVGADRAADRPGRAVRTEEDAWT